MDESRAQHKWSIKEGKPPKIFLSFNFTVEEQNLELSLEPTQLHWRIDPVTGVSHLSVRETEPSILLDSVKVPISKETIEKTASLGSTTENFQKVMGIVGSISLVMTLFSAGVPAGPVISLIKLFKMFFRLRLVNSDFGELLGYFLSMLGSVMQTTSYEFSDLDRTYFVKTRGKLTEYKVTVFAANILYDKMTIYLVR